MEKYVSEWNKFEPLPRRFFEPSAAEVAPRLLGHWLIRRTPEGLSGGLVVEAEAYLSEDPACHASRGMTRRNEAMFGEPGCAYVYLIYGMHYCFNAVCRPAGCGEAVLIRAIEPVVGEPLMTGRRVVANPVHLTNGPAKLCYALDLDRSHDRADLCSSQSPVFMAHNERRREFIRSRGPTVVGSRIGISVATELPLRFYLGGCRYVSKGVRSSLKGRNAAKASGNEIRGLAQG